MQLGCASSAPEKIKSPSALIEFTPHSATPTDGVASGDGDSSPDDVPMCIDSGRSVSAAAANTGSQWPLGNDGRPIGIGVLDEDDSLRALRRAALDLARRERGVPQRDQRLRNEAVRVRGAPLVEHPVVPRLQAREREVLVDGFEETIAAEAWERREQQLGPHAVFIHRAHALVDVERGGDHVVVVAREQIVAPARFAVAELPVCTLPWNMSG